MATKKKALQAAAGAAGGEALAIEDVFSTYLYTGNGSTQTITNGIDLDGEGGLVWMRDRNNANFHDLEDTERGAGRRIATNLTDAEVNLSGSYGINSFNSDGFSLIGNGTASNGSGRAYASWTWRKAPRFFDVVTYTGTGSNQDVPHNLGVVPGCIIIKEYSQSGWEWQVYHRSMTETHYMKLNLTDAASLDAGRFNGEPTDLVFKLGTNSTVNLSGGQYVAYLFAHDPLGPSGDGSDGLIACGSFTTNADGSLDLVDLGWEPQWLLIKNTSTTGNWEIHDVMRDGTLSTRLRANLSDAEVSYASQYIKAEATGFSAIAGWGGVSLTKAYIAIRRGPMRQPTSGTEVYDSLRFYGNDSTSRLLNFGFPTDLFFGARLIGDPPVIVDRLRGADKQIYTNGNYAEGTGTDYCQFDSNVGPIIGYNASGANINSSAYEYFSFVLKRAPGFFDVVAYQGGSPNNKQVAHNLGVTPELIVVKQRDGVSNWNTWAGAVGQNFQANGWNATTPFNDATGPYYFGTHTDTYFSVGYTGYETNVSSINYIAYLFATLAGVSKVGTYTGNGSSQTINCGFTSGARFVLIKRTDSTGNWLLYDSNLGITTSNDKFIPLNVGGENTYGDSIDYASSGFSVTEEFYAHSNVSGGSYIYLAIA